MATITVTKGLIGKEDINFEAADTAPSTFSRTDAAASTQSITKLAPVHLNIQDAGSVIAATNVETALQEIAKRVGGKGSDIASAATIAIPSEHLYFDVTGTTNISAITQDTNAAAGRLLILQFDGILTVRSSSTLLLEGDFTTGAGDHLMLVLDATASTWREIRRVHRHDTVLHQGFAKILVNTRSGDMLSTGNTQLVA